MKQGDKVFVQSEQFPDWNGHGVVTIPPTEGAKHSVNVMLQSGEMNGLEGGFPLEEVSLVEPKTVDDLREVVDSLRDQGYHVFVKVTDPAPASYQL